MVRQFLRVTNMESSRLANKILSWDKMVSEQFGFQTWYKEVKTIFETHNLLAFFGHGMNTPYIVEKLKQSMTVKQNVDLRIKCLNKPKLRTFNTFKDFGTTPPYLLLVIPLQVIQLWFALSWIVAICIRVFQ